MKIWILAPGENWIVDEMAKQFKQDNLEICTENIDNADVVWAMADWCWDRIPVSYLKSGKPILTMLHHFVPGKFSGVDEDNFVKRDRFTTAYTVPNFRTRDFISHLTNKTIHLVSYWAHTPSWKTTGTKDDFRKKYGIPAEAFVIGSWQRDTEGHDLKSPKLEKGPDLLADFICREHRKRAVVIGDTPKVHVLLAGWRRQYIISRLEKERVPYTYIELPSQETINELYQVIDLYPVTSRYEGGPQALIETGMLGSKAVSRPVGIAEQVLTTHAIADDVGYATPEVPNVEHLKTPLGYEPFIKLLKEVCSK